MTCLLKGKIAEPEESVVVRQQRYKHVSVAREADATAEGLSQKKQATREDLLETVVSM